jgi:hypothetical protein
MAEIRVIFSDDDRENEELSILTGIPKIKNTYKFTANILSLLIKMFMIISE